MKPQVEALQSSVVEGVDGTISAWVADGRNLALGQELSLNEEKTHADLVREGKLRELADWGNLMFTRNATRVMPRRKWCELYGS